MRNVMMGCAVLVASTGCAPLQQAPLVYSSKTVLGLDISATTTETPGASFHVGYKSVDAAYVPVAVAKPCEGSEKSAACSGDMYRLVQIAGGFRALNTNGSEDGKQAADRLLQQFEQAREQVSVAALALEAAAKAMEKAEQDHNEQVKRFDELEKKDEAARTAEEKQHLAGKVQRLGALKSVLTEKQKEHVAAKEKFDERQKIAQSFDPKAIADAQKRATHGENNKSDAYSVFGSFDAKTQAEITAAAPSQQNAGQAKLEPTLVLGKVFSTGVASQNLTEGMARFYAAVANNRAVQAVADCVTAAMKLKDDLIKTGLEACKSAERLHQPRSPSDDLLKTKELSPR